MRLIARVGARKSPLALQQMEPTEFLEMVAASLERNKGEPLTGIPVYWSRIGTELRFWPVRNPAYVEIVDLDHPSNKDFDTVDLMND